MSDAAGDASSKWKEARLTSTDLPRSREVPCLQAAASPGAVIE